jgi:choline dehydrogenase-like flavoprotein
VDSHGALYGAEDLYVCDTGLFPASPAVNPMLTAMALAHRMGGELLDRY